MRRQLIAKFTENDDRTISIEIVEGDNDFNNCEKIGLLYHLIYGITNDNFSISKEGDLK